MKTDPSTEIIEVLDDSGDAFGHEPSETASADSGGRRWAGPAAAAALVGLIGYGVVTSGSSSGAPKVAPAITTVAPSTTPPAPTTTIAEPLVPYYAADPPRQFTVQSVDLLEADGEGVFFDPRSYQLWATPDASASTGAWFSIESSRTGRQSTFMSDAYRVQIGNRSMAISHTSTGQTVVQFSVEPLMQATITAFGWSDEDLIRLAESLTVASGRGEDSEVTLSDPSLVADHALLSTVRPWQAVQANPIEFVFYASNVDDNGGIGISVSQQAGGAMEAGAMDRQSALRFLLGHSTPFDVNGRSAVAGEVIGGAGLSLASWIAGDHIVTVSALLPVPDLIAVARTVHQVSADEWTGMQFQALRHNADNNFGDIQQSGLQPVSFGTDSVGQPWSIEASIWTYPNHQEISWQWDQNGIEGAVADTATIQTVADDRRTYVFAELPRAVAGTGQLQVTRQGLDPITVPFTDIDTSFDRILAAYAFSEATPYTAQIIGADGAVIASWPSS